MKIVLDTNIWVSAYLWGGVPRQVISAAVERGTSILISLALLDEARRTFAKEKFTALLEARSRTVEGIVAEIKKVTIIVEVKTSPIVSRDRDDDQVIACAVAGGAACIVSGDDDLLDLKEYGDIKIMTAADFLIVLENQS